MMNRSHGRYATRLALAGAVAGFVCLAYTGAADAATLPDPLGSLVTAPSVGADPLGGVVTGATDATSDTLDQFLGAGGTTPSAGLPSGLPGGLPSGLPEGLPALPALPGTSPEGAQGGSGVTADAQAPAGDNLAAVDAAVATYLGVCARVPQGVAPLQADIVVLDRNLITELVDAGVPLQQLVVPCPRAAMSPPPAGSAAAAPGRAVTGARPSATPAPASAVPTSLAFTGIDVAPTLLSGLGLVALGAAFLRRARLLGDLPTRATRDS
jgi:hypothetical protein